MNSFTKKGYTKEVLQDCSNSSTLPPTLYMSSNPEKATRLTPKEILVVTDLANGLLYKEIAINQGISIETVKKHVKNIYRKLDARNRTEAVNQYYAYSIK